jgi:anaerobic ribonucleoside-triphosphate reductase
MGGNTFGYVLDKHNDFSQCGDCGCFVRGTSTEEDNLCTSCNSTNLKTLTEEEVEKEIKYYMAHYEKTRNEILDYICPTY